MTNHISPDNPSPDAQLSSEVLITTEEEVIETLRRDDSLNL